ncbi:MAG: hypothetical protein D4S01_03640, partial [Dehalococcoidia bacterium]
MVERKEELRQATFRCTHCDSGVEVYSDLFKRGSCVNCGAPAGEVIELSIPRSETMNAFRKSVLVVYGEKDREIAYNIMDELSETGVEVIDPMVVIGNERGGEKMNTAGWMVTEAMYTLVIPWERSNGKEADSNVWLLRTAVETGFMNGNRKIIPVYPDKSFYGKQ